MNNIRILAVDDHEMTLIGYKYILEEISFNNQAISVETATNFEVASRLIINSNKSVGYNVILLDIQLGATKEENASPKTGEDLGILAREYCPDASIVFLSSFSDNYRINSILNSVNPEGYMVKAEIDQKALEAMIKTVLTSPPYYTKKALIAIRKRMANDLPLDDNDKKILFHLSIGTKTKDMSAHISLSLPGIENRKRQLKKMFCVEKQNDQALITEGKRRGFI